MTKKHPAEPTMTGTLSLSQQHGRMRLVTRPLCLRHPSEWSSRLQAWRGGLCETHRQGRVCRGVPQGNLPVAAQPVGVVGALRGRLHRRRQRLREAARQLLAGRRRSRRVGRVREAARQQRSARRLPLPAVQEAAPARVVAQQQIVAAQTDQVRRSAERYHRKKAARAE